MTQENAQLPAQSLIAPLAQAIADKNVIIGAPPGAGKSTVLPQALLPHVDGKILVMQPRRVVVRSLAGYLAQLLGEKVGATIGYRIRGEAKSGPDTRIEIITEGILARLIQSDPELHGIGAIVFDEFHERSIHSDFGLALALDVQAGLRDDLRLVVMSATLDTGALQALLPDAALLTTEGRAYPVSVVYGKDVPGAHIVSQVIATLRYALHTHEGDVLVFLPGQGAINHIAGQLNTLPGAIGSVIHRLYGALPKAQQDAALKPDAMGRRKVILATNIAETSLTIDGIEVVIDSGLENIASFNPSSGLTTLRQQRISQASARQRAGRAGRVQAGHCYRLWSQASHERLSEHTAPQIKRVDIAPLLLDTLNWGCNLDELAMLSRPDAAQVDVARALLVQIGALDESYKLTAMGRDIAAIPCHPRLAAMLLRVKNMDTHTSANLDTRLLRQAAPWVVALAEDSARSDQTHISEALMKLDASARRRMENQARRFARYCGADVNALSPAHLDSEAIAACVALAYSDRVAYRRNNRYKLASGKGASYNAASQPQWLSVLHAQDQGTEVALRMIQPVSQETLNALFPGAFVQRDVVRFNADRQAMEARRVTGFGEIDLTYEPIGKIASSQWVDAWLRFLSERQIQDWPLGEEAWQWWRRLSLAASLALPIDDHGQGLTWPGSLTTLVEGARDSLASYLKKCRSLRELSAIPWATVLHQSLPWPLQQALSSQLPTQLPVPSGRKHALRYDDNQQVVLAVRMQEMYGQTQPLSIAGGRITVTLELLSPAGRPIQTTADLANFWQGSYLDIQKEMKGRYPKHFWPDDPTTAQATTRTKNAMN
ncbi:ATP-dependent RNA helicase HrpB [Alteromonas halophila]|uniref:ATP-dependent RNA helicase HrpB n=2 Tax=Alteromonas halophila TaxID=516698 RepID=A0A918JJ52_9ALTE|nr:ATP-dependent RNA helicase HrpB [Alteromonas halophila]